METTAKVNGLQHTHTHRNTRSMHTHRHTHTDLHGRTKVQAMF